LNNNDDEGLMPKKSCQRFKDSYQDTWNFICASKKYGENVVVNRSEIEQNSGIFSPQFE
jgi:hypothetical protein